MMTRLNLICILTALVAPALAIGCGDDAMVPTDTGIPMGDSSTPIDSSTPMDSGMPTDTSVPPGDDGNDDFSEAEALASDGTGVMAAIQEPSDSDYFSFDLNEGDWVVLDIEANPDDDTNMVDTVIQLFDASMTMVAENDDSVPRANTDSELIYLVPATGTYYARVLEFSDWAGETPEGQADYIYTITVNVIDSGLSSLTIDAEGGDDVASAQALNFFMDGGLVVGTFEDDTDIDVFSFTVPDGQFLSVQMMPAGVTGYGSTGPIGDISITDTAGTDVIGRLNNATNDFERFSPALSAGDYLLQVEHGGTAAGTNDFFVLKVIKSGDNPPEMNEAANGTMAGSEALMQTLDMATMSRRAFVLAQMPTETDIDYYSFDATAGEAVSVFCGSKSLGSGVNGLTVEVRDASDVLVPGGSSAENPTDGVVIRELALTPGTYHMRLSRGAQDPVVSSTFVRCGLATFVPAAAP